MRMSTKIIALANQKGGSGKTTLSMQLAGTLVRRGWRVLVVDADTQGTATRWAASAVQDERPFPAHVAGLAAAGGKIHREVKKYLGSYDFIVIDCPPAVDSPVPQSALMIADLVLIPIIPSPADIWAGRGIKQLVENVQDFNEKLETRLVANMVQQTALGRDAMEILSDFGLPLADTQLGHRTAYRESAILGGTVHDVGAKGRKAVQEMESLAGEVLRILGAPEHSARQGEPLAEMTPDRMP
jgi:chromosome partitioning protein